MNGKMCDSRDEERMNGSFHFTSTFKSGHIEPASPSTLPCSREVFKKISIEMYSI